MTIKELCELLEMLRLQGVISFKNQDIEVTLLPLPLQQQSSPHHIPPPPTQPSSDDDLLYWGST